MRGPAFLGLWRFAFLMSAFALIVSISLLIMNLAGYREDSISAAVFVCVAPAIATALSWWGMRRARAGQ